MRELGAVSRYARASTGGIRAGNDLQAGRKACLFELDLRKELRPTGTPPERRQLLMMRFELATDTMPEVGIRPDQDQWRQADGDLELGLLGL
jgi:hypothetical protein